MRAVARRISGHKHEVEVDGHSLIVDEPVEAGGTDAGPSPTRLLTAALASCVAITIGMYAARKGWDIEGVEVSAEFAGPPRAGETAHFAVELSLPDGLSAEQAERIRVIAGKCPVHRTLAGPVEIETWISGA